jgi:uncharacterized protein involved in exopolysaccharide biosynthesis
MKPWGFDEPVAGPAPDGTLDLLRLAAAVSQRKRWIVIPTLLSFVAAVAFVTLATPRYTGVAKVLLVNQESYFTRPDKAGADTAAPYDSVAVQSVAEALATTNLAHKAVDRLALSDREEFNPARSSNLLIRLLTLFGASNQDRIVETFLAHLTVFPVAKSRVLQIEFTSMDPALAAEGANTMAELLLDQQEEAKKNEVKAAAAWLATRIEQLRAKVAEADAKVELFRAASGLLAGANGMTVPTQQLAEINAQIAAARGAQAAATAKAQMLREMLRAGRLDSVAGVANDESLRRYAELRVTLKAQISGESRALLPGHPRMKELSGQLTGLEEGIRGAAAEVVGGLENEAELAGAQVRSLESALAAQSKTVASGNVDEVQLHALEVDAKTAREQLESYIGKYREAVARDADNAAPPNARIIATASEPRTPSFPNKGPTILLVTLASFCLSASLAIAKALLADTPRGAERDSREWPDELESAVSLAAETDRDEAKDPAATVDRLVDTMADAADSGAQMTLLVTGEATPGALAIALTAARRLSKRGGAALLDVGATQPWLGDVFDRGPDNSRAMAGLADVLDGRASFEQALYRDLSTSLDILPAGNGEVDKGMLEPVLESLAQSYRYVVVHASDWRSPPACEAISAATAAIVCAPAGRVEAARQRLREALADRMIPMDGVVVGGGRRRAERAA